MYSTFSRLFYLLIVGMTLSQCSHLLADATDYQPRKFVVLTPPKCGTHLIAKLLDLMLDQKPEYHLVDMGSTEEFVERCCEAVKNSRFVVAHNFNEESLSILIKEGYKILFILRDPRDQLISMADWMQEGQWNWVPAAKIQKMEERITELITGKRFGFRCYENCIGSRYDIVKKINPKDCYITRFELLVGDEGGGDKILQLEEILNIASFLDIEIDIDIAEDIADNVFGGTRTFRRGLVGVWKERMTERQKRLYKSLYTTTLINLGYEKGSDW